MTAPCASCGTPTPLSTDGEPRCLACKWPGGSPASVTTPGRCDTGQPVCGQPARLYAAGWRCDKHTPTAQTDRKEAA